MSASSKTIAYSSADPRQILVSYNDGASEKTPIVFIHGGAWRDPNNTAHDFDKLVSFLPRDIPMFSIDYRLSPKVKHPAHEEDVIGALTKISELISTGDEIRKINIVGHSAGASLALRTFDQISSIQVEHLILLDGIFDLTELVKEYPSYQGFVDEAFSNYKEVSFTTSENFHEPKIHIIQSHEDELLSLRQSEWLADQLEQRCVEYTKTFGHYGQHEDVYKHKEIASYIEALYL